MVAAQVGVNEKTVRNAAKFEEALKALEQVSPQAAQKVLRGEVKDVLTMLPKLPTEALEYVAQRIEKGAPSIKRARMEWYQQQREEKLKERVKDTTAAACGGQPFTLHCCDIKQAHEVVPADSVDLIITDPPYGREYLPLYEELTKFAAHALKEGGICLVLTEQAHLPEILNLMGKYLKYWWLMCYYMLPPTSLIFGRDMVNDWKPILYYVKGSEPFAGQVSDVVVSPAPQKGEHEWQQNLEAFSELVRRFAREGMIICDPFCGSGTTGVAALAHGCRFIGLDIDPQAIETARKRLSATNE